MQNEEKKTDKMLCFDGRSLVFHYILIDMNEGITLYILLLYIYIYIFGSMSWTQEYWWGGGVEMSLECRVFLGCSKTGIYENLRKIWGKSGENPRKSWSSHHIVIHSTLWSGAVQCIEPQFICSICCSNSRYKSLVQDSLHFLCASISIFNFSIFQSTIRNFLL